MQCFKVTLKKLCVLNIAILLVDIRKTIPREVVTCLRFLHVPIPLTTPSASVFYSVSKAQD